ncbi:MAG: right-handed parallel beta-helix repeat-containing protein [Luteibaculum sp.]
MPKLFTVLLVLTSLISFSQGKKIEIDPNDGIVKDGSYNSVDIEPGDTLVLKGDANKQRIHLQLNNLHGALGNPIVVTSEENEVITIANSTQGYGIYLQNCTHIKIDGAASDTDHSNGIHYGIKIEPQTETIAIKAEHGTSFLTINRVWILYSTSLRSGSDKPAILVKSNAQCHADTARYSEDTFLLQDLSISNCKIDNAPGEAIYLGETGKGDETPCTVTFRYELDFNEYTGELVEIQKQWGEFSVNTVKPHYLDNVVVENNEIHNPGWDGIQLSRCHNFIVRNNVVEDYGLKNDGHISGIIIGEGSSGEIYGNYVGNGAGASIEARPAGNLWIFNNFLANSGQGRNWGSAWHAAINTYAENIDSSFVRGKNLWGEKSIRVTHNLIYHPKHHGIRLNSKGLTTGTRDNHPFYQAICLANAICDAGAAAINIQSTDDDINPLPPYNSNVDNWNEEVLDKSQLKLSDTSPTNPYDWNIRPTTASPLLDAAPVLYENQVYRDYYNQRRGPFVTVPKLLLIKGAGRAPDMGPAEWVAPQIEVQPGFLRD